MRLHLQHRIPVQDAAQSAYGVFGTLSFSFLGPCVVASQCYLSEFRHMHCSAIPFEFQHLNVSGVSKQLD